MTAENKLATVKTMLDISGTSEDTKITVYLNAAEAEIIAWRYGSAVTPPETFPEEYDMTEVFAVIAGYSQRGAENQLGHTENGIYRTFKYEDMIAYIRAHVIPYCKVM